MDLAKKKARSDALHRAPSIPTSRRPSGCPTPRWTRGGDVYLYLIDDAVAARRRPARQALAERGAKLFVCAYGCQKRRLPLSRADASPTAAWWC